VLAENGPSLRKGYFLIEMLHSSSGWKRRQLS